MLTGTPRTPATAHSTWGLSAGGAECTCRTPLTVTLASLRADEVRLPQRPQLRRRPAQMPGSRHAAASTPLRIVPHDRRPALPTCRVSRRSLPALCPCAALLRAPCRLSLTARRVVVV